MEELDIPSETVKGGAGPEAAEGQCSATTGIERVASKALFAIEVSIPRFVPGESEAQEAKGRLTSRLLPPLACVISSAIAKISPDGVYRVGGLRIVLGVSRVSRWREKGKLESLFSSGEMEKGRWYFFSPAGGRSRCWGVEPSSGIPGADFRGGGR